MSDEPGDAGEVTGLLRIAGRDVQAADRMWRLVYPELRRRAGQLVRNERTDHTLSATAIVNETFVRLSTRTAQEWDDRSHFYNVALTIMRHVLIDYARQHRAEKRGGGVPKQELDESAFPPRSGPMRRASGSPEKLSQEHERSALVVRLRVFGGLTIPEIAAEVRGAERTVKNDWARVRLAKLLKEY